MALIWKMCCACKGPDPEILRPYVGGAFGSGLRRSINCRWPYHGPQLKLKRSVRVSLKRHADFTFAYAAQHSAWPLVPPSDGQLQGILQPGQFAPPTSRFETLPSRESRMGAAMLYKCPGGKTGLSVGACWTFTHPLETCAPPGATIGV